jgi:hypothetical protein
MVDNVDGHSGMSKNSSDSRFLQIDHQEIQHMHLFNSASFDTNNEKYNVNEARNENVDNLNVHQHCPPFWLHERDSLHLGHKERPSVLCS